MHNSDRFLCLRVDIDDLKRVFIRCTLEKSLSTVHVVIGKVTMTLNNAFMLELMSMGQLSSTSTSVEYLCFSVCIFRLKRWIKTVNSASSTARACMLVPAVLVCQITWILAGRQLMFSWCCMCSLGIGCSSLKSVHPNNDPDPSEIHVTFNTCSLPRCAWLQNRTYWATFTMMRHPTSKCHAWSLVLQITSWLSHLPRNCLWIWPSSVWDFQLDWLCLWRRVWSSANLWLQIR